MLAQQSNAQFFSRLKKIGLKGIYNFLKNRLIKNHVEENIYNKWFSNKWRKLDKTIPYIEVENINSQLVFKILKEINPDLILDHGTSIVKNHILENAKLALNLHWGLSPYYRGTHCTDWALINWDPNNIGVNSMSIIIASIKLVPRPSIILENFIVSS